MQENYQPVVLRKILRSKGGTKQELEEELRKYNPESTSQSMTNTVLTVLQRERNNMIRKEGDKFIINSFHELSPSETQELVDACDKAIEDFDARKNNLSSEKSKRLILFSVASDAAYSHFEKTILQDVHSDNLPNSELSKYTNLRMWGSVPSKSSIGKWRRLNKGDIILFYKDKNYIASGIVEGTTQDSNIAKNLWGVKDEEGLQTWELIIYIKPENISESNVDFDKVNNLLGYQSGFMPTRTLDFTTVNENKCKQLEAKHGNLETALNSIGFSVGDETNYWKIAPGEQASSWDDQKRLGIIGIGWNEIGNLAGKSVEYIHDKLKEFWPNSIANNIPQFRSFVSIKKGDIILANKGKSKIVGIGRVTGNYQYQPNLKHAHTYSVEWFDTIEKEIPSQGGWMVTVLPLTKEKFEELISPSKETGNYYIISQYEGSRYDDKPGVQYQFDSNKPHYKNFVEGTNFIVQSKIRGQNYFVGYGKVGKLEKTPGTNPNGNPITKIVAKFSKYKKFPGGINRSEEINEKMLRLAFPGGGRNIPPAMLPITKELYDEIIFGTTQTLIEKEKTSTSSAMIDDNFESLIRKFDENRNLFNPEWIDQKQESLKNREEFVAKFPVDNIKEISLDDYVIGKPNPINGEVRRDTFSYILEKSLNSFGRIAGRWSRFHGIYWRKESNSYVWNGDFENPEDAFSEIKNQISGMLKAAQILEQDKDWDKFSEYMMTQEKTLMANVKSKILSVYFPKVFLNLHKKALLTDLLDELEIRYGKKSSRYIKEKLLLDYKNENPIMKNWDNLDYGHFLWHAILKKIDEDEIEPEEFNEIDEVVSEEETFETFEDEKLILLTPTEIKAGYEKISDELLIPEEKITEIITALASGRHLLIAGPIGTGKTRLAKIIPEIFWEKVGGYYSEDHTATADWSTQDVIGGIFPKMEDGKPVYDIQNGCVVETVRKNWANGVNGGMRRPAKNPSKNPPYRGTWLIIDEFNRADIDKAFGQLFTALRTRWLKIPTDQKGLSYKNLKIPQDYRIIGTLNTADKHFLFQLSDALKSRFAYIEIDIPKKEQWEKEIYYTMRNALKELDIDNFNKIVFDDTNKKINKEKSDTDFYNRILQAYHFLDTVRVFKKLGPAILKLIYQNLIVGTIITEDSKTALDNALTSNLIPQLENLSVTFIAAIHAMHSDSLISYLKDAYKSPNRQSHVEAFEKILDYLQLSNKTKLVSDFANGNIKIENEDVWRPIQIAYDNKKKDFEIKLGQITESMDDLIKTMVI